MEDKSPKKKSKTKKIIIGIVIVLVLVAAAIVFRYILALNGFLDKITNWGPEKKEYSVIVMNSSDVSELSGLENKGVGFLETDTEVARAKQYLENIIKIDADVYDLDTMIDIFESRVIEAMVLETDRLEILKEEMEDFTNNTRVIDTFEIELDDKKITISEKEVTTEPFVVYLSGSDSRNGIKATARSDVNIVVVVNPEQGKILLVSIPRDTYVQLHGTTGLKDKLTHAGIYGIDMSKTTIEDFLDIQIDHTIKVSFDTVVRVVDQIDGIEINSDQEMKLKVEGKDKICEFIVGTQQVDGDCALLFARERKSYKTGDRHRGENQQQVITSIIGKLSSSRDYLLKLPAILDIAADSFETTLRRDDIMAFVRMQLGKTINWKVESISIDGSGMMEPTYSMGANTPLYVMIPSEESIIKVTSKINDYLLKNESSEQEQMTDE
ncbi:LCP family protein [Candidatus Saccharibacteria bacterium]|nr:LCP family protein [Candidatus Saccharibacteria bacterium]